MWHREKERFARLGAARESLYTPMVIIMKKLERILV
jgi:hypothetical protein